MATNDIRRRKPRGPKYNKAIHPELAHGLALLGYIDVEIATAMGISKSTLYNWKRDHLDFAAAIERGREPIDVEITQALYKKAKGGYIVEDKVVKQSGEEKVVQVRRYVEPDTQAIIYFLNNRRGDKWQTRKAMEHAGPKGAPIQHSNQIATSAGVERALVKLGEMLR